MLNNETQTQKKKKNHLVKSNNRKEVENKHGFCASYSRAKNRKEKNTQTQKKEKKKRPS